MVQYRLATGSHSYSSQYVVTPNGTPLRVLALQTSPPTLLLAYSQSSVMPMSAYCFTTLRDNVSVIYIKVRLIRTT